jgi:hypothetical protein
MFTLDKFWQSDWKLSGGISFPNGSFEKWE